jgi:hypothetical protein
MIEYDHSLKNHSWEELLSTIASILERDGKNLQSNVNYYKKLIDSGTADGEQLNRLFERLQIDKYRFTYLSEIFFRLDTQKGKFILMSIQDAMEKEYLVNPRELEEWSILVCREKNSLKTYLLPHKKQKI